MKMSFQRKILFAILVPVVLVLGAEVGLRLVCWAIGYRPYHSVVTRWMVPDADLVFDYRPNYEGKIYGAEAKINSLGLRGEEIRKAKPQGTWRALCIGDSTTFGYVLEQGQSYPEQLQAILRKRFPERSIEVLNAGRVSYTSYQGLKYLEKKGLAFEPDVVLAAFSHNDRRFVLKPEQADGPAWFRKQARALRWRGRARHSYLLLAIGKLMRRFAREDTWEEDVLELESQRLEDLHPRAEVGAYKKNLREMARLCRQRKTPIVFLVMSDAPHVLDEFAEARRLRSRKSYDEAVEILRGIGDDLPESLYRRWFKPLAYYEIGLIREEDGRTTEAAEAFRHSARSAAFWSTAGGTAIRHAEEYAEAMREVANEVGAPALDVANLLEDRPDLYVDHCHFRPEGHRLIAEAVAELLVDKGILSAPDER